MQKQEQACKAESFFPVDRQRWKKGRGPLPWGYIWVCLAQGKSGGQIGRAGRVKGTVWGREKQMRSRGPAFRQFPTGKIGVSLRNAASFARLTARALLMP